MWHVNLHIENNGVFMGGENWQDFIQDNDLETGYILHFKYKDNMVFTFRIYDKTSNERASGKQKIIKHLALMLSSFSVSSFIKVKMCFRFKTSTKQFVLVIKEEAERRTH